MNILSGFKYYLEAQDRSPLTVSGYLTDLQQFIRWFEQTNGESFSLPGITPTDVREYRQFLLNLKRRKPNTVNRHLAALTALMAWGKKSGGITARTMHFAGDRDAVRRQTVIAALEGIVSMLDAEP